LPTRQEGSLLYFPRRTFMDDFPRLFNWGWRSILIGYCGVLLRSGVAAGRLPDGENQAPLRLLHQRPIATDAGAESRGRALFAKHCACCHGPSGRGDGSAGRDLDPQPSDLAQPEVLEKSDAQLFRQITRGRRPMPSFNKLSEEDRWHIIQYIRTLARHSSGGIGR
jgi:mono/diheme cytochrome c family protein